MLYSVNFFLNRKFLKDPISFTFCPTDKFHVTLNRREILRDFNIQTHGKESELPVRVAECVLY